MSEIGKKVKQAVKISKKYQIDEENHEYQPTPYERVPATPKDSANNLSTGSHQNDNKNLKHRLFMAFTHWTFVIGIMLGLAGLGLVFISGPVGMTEFKLFGQSFSSVNVGIAAIFIAAVVVVLNSRRILSSIDKTNI